MPKLVREGEAVKAVRVHDGEGHLWAAVKLISATEKRKVPRHVCHAISASCGELAPGPQAASLAALGRWKWVCLAEPILTGTTRKALNTMNAGGSLYLKRFSGPGAVGVAARVGSVVASNLR